MYITIPQLFISTVILFVIVLCLVASIINYEIRKQAMYEEKARKRWDTMTEEEQIASGRENVYC